jgi:hypothetical protein
MDTIEVQTLDLNSLSNKWTLIRSRGADTYETVIDLTVVKTYTGSKIYNATINRNPRLMDETKINQYVIMFVLFGS